jgi:hypothetical protein
MELDMLSLRNVVLVVVLAVACSAAPGAPSAPAPVPAPMASATPAEPPDAASPPVEPPVDAGTAEAGPPEAAPVPTGTVVLHIGDSMAGALGIELNKELARVGMKGRLRYKEASFIPNWAGGPDLPVYLYETKPDLVLISLGANEVQIPDEKIRLGRANAVRKLVARLKGLPCVWIAPPLWDKGDTGLLPVIRENCAPCLYMDTNTLVHDMPRVSDKIHPAMSARPVWARYVVEWLLRQRDPHGARPWDLLPAEAVAHPGLDFPAP